MTKALIEAIERGELSNGQLRELIADQARELGTTFEQALEAASDGSLPRNALGADIALLIRLLNRHERREAV